MQYLLLLVLLIVNSVISALNAYGAGASYSEAKAIGGWTRTVNIAALVMAAVGWSWVILTIETMVVVTLGYLTPEEGEAMFSLGYLIMIVPLIGSGFALWVNSLIRAYQTRRLGDIGVAGWNTFAQVHNIYSAAKHAPGAVESVVKVFGSLGKSKGGRQLVLIILLVVVALGGGVLITIAIARWADRNHAIQVTGTR